MNRGAVCKYTEQMNNSLLWQKEENLSFE